MNDLLEKKPRHFPLTIGALIVFIGTLFLYMRTLAPSVATIFDDSLEFQLVCYQSGIAHPTGYPLYTMLGKLFTLLPLGDVAYRVNLMSAVWGAVAAVLVYLLVWRLTRRILPAIGAAACLAVAPIFWSQAVIAEVYTLNAVFLAGALWLITRKEPRRAMPLAAWYGLSLTHHRTMFLWIPAFAVYLWLTDRAIFRDWRRLAKLAVAATAPLLLYLYIPLRGTALTSLDGTYQNTLAGFWSHISGGAYTSFFAENPLAKNFGLQDYGALLIAQFGAAGIIGALVGFAGAWRRRIRVENVLLLSIFSINSLWVLLYRVPDPEVFTIPSLVIIAVWIGLGINAAVQFAMYLTSRGLALFHPFLYSPPTLAHSPPSVPPGGGEVLFSPLRRELEGGKLIQVMIFALFAILPLSTMLENYAQVDLSHDWEVHDYGLDILSQPLEENAALVGLLGEMTLVRYFQQTEGLRPDIQTFVANDEAQRLETVRQLMDAGQHVYLTRPLRGVEEEFSLFAVGSLIKVRTNAQVVAPQMLRIDSQLLNRHNHRAVRVTVVWQAPAPLASSDLVAPENRSYQVSARVLNTAGRIVGQHDGIPVHDAYPTTAWRAGEVITDVYDVSIQRGTPPGEHHAQVIMYEPESQAEIWRGEAAPIELPRDVQHIACPNQGAVQSLSNVVQSKRVVLCDAEVLTPELKSGETLRLDLLWKARRTADEAAPQTVRVWLESPGQGARVLAETPLSSHYPPHLWKRGEVVREEFAHTLPARLNEDDYQVCLRLLPIGNKIALGEVRITDREHSFTLPPLVHPLNDGVVWDKVARLLGYDLEITNGEMRLILYWRAIGETDVSYTVFVHIVDATGKIRAQRDSVPGNAALPTSGWVQDEIITDEYVIPRTNLEPGAYNIIVGMYDARTGERLPIMDADSGEARGDSLTVTSVEIDAFP